jgi:hypothetical protein
MFKEALINTLDKLQNVNPDDKVGQDGPLGLKIAKYCRNRLMTGITPGAPVVHFDETCEVL